jgi:LuxR family transcriptional regulator, maltose regulon positive regulatory protein
MISNLISTKFYIPSPRLSLVRRSRLIDQLNRGLERKLTLLSAPAGYGKSTLLGEWAHQVNYPVAWLSLDKRDNDPSRFWSYFVAALHTIPDLRETQMSQVPHPIGIPTYPVGIPTYLVGGPTYPVGEDLLELETDPQTQTIEAALTSLVAEIDRRPGRCILILDDLHLVSDSRIHDGLIFLLEHLPPAPGGIHLAIASRMDPPWSLARWRVRGEVTEVRAADLRFTSEEATAFLHEVKGLNLSPRDISELGQRTEGWIAGLNMAALSMQGSDNATAFLEKFSGSHTFILDYILEEVLSQQSPETLDFLLKTSILEHLTAPLCDSVLESRNSQAVLSYLEKTNGFLVPLDDERGWYRYHHLFGDLLRKRLAASLGAQVPGLYTRASKWCEENGLHYEAIHYALDADDMEQAAHLVTANILLMAESHKLTDLLEHINALPQKDLRSRPWLCVASAWVRAYAGQLDGAEVLVGQVEEALSAGETTNEAERARLTGHVMAVRAFNQWILGHAEQAVKAARQALAQLPSSDSLARANVLLIIGLALPHLADYAGAIQAFEDSIALSRKTGNLFLEIYALSCLAFTIKETGQLHHAFRICEEAILKNEQHRVISGQTAIPGEQYLSLGLGYGPKSEVLWLWGDLNGALAAAQEAVKFSEQWRQADHLHYSLTCLSNAYLALGDIHNAHNILERAKRIAKKVSSDWFIAISDLQEVEINLASANLHFAEQWLQRYSSWEADKTPTHVALAKVLVALGRYSEALGHLDLAFPHLHASGHGDSVLLALILKAQALSAQGQVELALQVLKTALVQAEAQGYVQYFVCQGEPLAVLLRLALKRDILPGYVKKLLAEMARQDAVVKGIQVPEQPPGVVEGLIEPLSERELEVLRLLNTRLSVPEIAQKLFVARSTIRTHIRNIFDKLNVHRRTDAVQEAKKLKLI